MLDEFFVYVYVCISKQMRLGLKDETKELGHCGEI